MNPAGVRAFDSGSRIGGARNESRRSTRLQPPGTDRHRVDSRRSWKGIEEKIWLVSFMHYDLGFFDHETGRVECAENPFQARVLPMPSE